MGPQTSIFGGIRGGHTKGAVWSDVPSQPRLETTILRPEEFKQVTTLNIY